MHFDFLLSPSEREHDFRVIPAFALFYLISSTTLCNVPWPIHRIHSDLIEEVPSFDVRPIVPPSKNRDNFFPVEEVHASIDSSY